MMFFYMCWTGHKVALIYVTGPWHLLSFRLFFWIQQKRAFGVFFFAIDILTFHRPQKTHRSWRWLGPNPRKQSWKPHLLSHQFQLHWHHEERQEHGGRWVWLGDFCQVHHTFVIHVVGWSLLEIVSFFGTKHKHETWVIQIILVHHIP